MSSKKSAARKKVSKESLVLPGLLKEIRGPMPAQDFAVKHGLRIGTLNNWEQGKSVPRLDQAISLMKALGTEGLERFGVDLGGLMDTLRGDMKDGKREAHHWLDEIYKHAPKEMQAHVLAYLRERGGKYGEK